MGTLHRRDSPLPDLRAGGVGNDEGQRRTIGNPCQVSTQGVVASIKGAKYGTQTAEVAPCLTPRSVLSLTRSDCALTARGVTAPSAAPHVVVASDLVDPGWPMGGSEP